MSASVRYTFFETGLCIYFCINKISLLINNQLYKMLSI